MSIQVNDFQYIQGKNDSEYIKLLKDALERLDTDGLRDGWAVSRASVKCMFGLGECDLHDAKFVTCNYCYLAER